MNEPPQEAIIEAMQLLAVREFRHLAAGGDVSEPDFVGIGVGSASFTSVSVNEN